MKDTETWISIGCCFTLLTSQKISRKKERKKDVCMYVWRDVQRSGNWHSGHLINELKLSLVSHMSAVTV